jgi:hypothetical protein
MLLDGYLGVGVTLALALHMRKADNPSVTCYDTFSKATATRSQPEPE